MPKGGARPQCSLPDCVRPHCAKGYCSKHYEKFIRLPRDRSSQRRCRVDSCRLPGDYAGSLCASHMRRGGAPDPVRGRAEYVPEFVGMHYRIRALWGGADGYACIRCGEPADQWAYDGTDPDWLLELSGPKKGMRYSRWPEFYMPMCRKCHVGRDKAAAKEELFQYRLLQWNNKERRFA